MVQKLFFDHYPFCYKSVLQWVVKNGTLRLERVTYPNKRKDIFIKLLPLLITFNLTILSFWSLLYLSHEQDTVLRKDFRYWIWLFLGTSSLREAFIYYIIGFGSQSKSVAPLLNEATDLVNEMLTRS